jgi:hypothetical protein
LLPDELFGRFFKRHWDDGAWPFVRLPLDNSRYLEIEYAEVEEMEAQDRVWIDSGDGRRVLLEFESPRLSFPTLRMAELLMIGTHENDSCKILIRTLMLCANEPTNQRTSRGAFVAPVPAWAAGEQMTRLCWRPLLRTVVASSAGYRLRAAG